MDSITGGGIFGLPYTIASYGQISLVATLIATVGAVALALLFSVMSRRLPADGGFYAIGALTTSSSPVPRSSSTRPRTGCTRSRPSSWSRWSAHGDPGMRIVVALGGNALLQRGEKPDSTVQIGRVEQAAPALAEVAAHHELVLVHGNGPQVGMLALESAADESLSMPYPFSELVAETQGLIGYWLQQALTNAGLAKPVVTLITQTVTDAADPAYADPSKFVGSVYDESTARDLAARHGWVVRRDGAGWRRVVASPLPVRIAEIETARTLLQHGTTVVLAGGGGVPVVDGPEGLEGVDAVIDKDHVAALVATHLGADLLVMLTDVSAVMTDFGTPHQHPISHVSASNLGAAEFPAGSMGPKVIAACAFVSDTGGRAAIGSLVEAAAVIVGTAGTQVAQA